MSNLAKTFTLGSVAGLAATAPMSAVMEALHQLEPAPERQPLPPRQITMEIAERLGMKDELDEPERQALTQIAHFGYGAVMGGLYACLAKEAPLPPAVRGAAFGLAVWAGSYLGLLPALGIHPSAANQPASRNALMITAHLVWGGSLGLLVEAFADRQ